MIIFTTNGDLNVVKHPSREPVLVFIPPLGLPYTLPFVLSNGTYESTINVSIYDKATRETTTFTDIDAFYSNGVITFDLTFQGVENNQYYMMVTDNENGNALFNSNLVCTDQTNLQNFEILKDSYTIAPQTNNEFLQY